MKNTFTTLLSEENINEYLLLISPDESVNEKIKQRKEIFSDKLKCPSCLRIKPHITLINFVQYKTMESKFIQRLEHYTNTVNPFSVSLNNFGSFPSHTIFINVQTKNNIVQTVRDLREIKLPIRIDKDRSPHYITEPHITLARRLEPWQYEKGWLEWSNKNFHATFHVKELVLLRRKDSSSPCIKIASFQFKGIKNKVQQTLLF